MKLLTYVLLVLVASTGAVVSADELSKRDQIHIAVQEICPVSGQKLGDHGAPLKVKIGEERVFLCCKACLQGEVNPQHWAKIHENFAAAQGICPVMKKDLPQNPKWTIIEGQIVYVCCPPCTKKLAADPQAVLQQIDDLYLASLQARQKSR
jgi:hypothetical protein